MNFDGSVLLEMNKIQIEMFKDFDSVCKKLGIQYFLIHGSLLGAIRNGQFVEYDDDIDIALLREDYEKLINSKDLFKKKYFLQCDKTEKYYYLNFAKLIDLQTTYIVEGTENLKLHHGVYIDIFPIDFYEKRKLHDLLLKFAQVRVAYSTKQNKTLIYKAVYLFSHLLFSRKGALKFINKPYIRKQTERIIIRGGKKADIGLNYSMFFPPRKIKFEGVESWCPNDSNSYLEAIYGKDFFEYDLVEKLKCENGMIITNASYISLNEPCINGDIETTIQ